MSSAPVNHVFVDYENVHAVDLAIIGSKSVHFTLLVGATQKKLDAALVEQLFAHAATVHLVRLTSSGRNALDFALAYHLGQAVATDPEGSFHIVSRDTGFEPLLTLLQRRHLDARRHGDFAQLSLALGLPKNAVDPDDYFTRALHYLHKIADTRPKRANKLSSGLKAQLGNSAKDVDVRNVIERLRKERIVVIDDKGAVTYHMPAS